MVFVLWSLRCIVIANNYRAFMASLVAQMVKNLPAVWETQVWCLGREDPLEKEMAAHSSILAWSISWTEEPGGLQSMGSQRVWHDWLTNTYTHTHTHNTHTHTHTEHLIYASHCSKCLTPKICLWQQSCDVGTVIVCFYRSGNWGTGRLSPDA